ncbi:acyl-CoA dehydrogenase family protein [Chachezhania sediminis]|uniref:acyl-CoA dehydrogenase family protein n=1 Tax=Chachezhania sediminis TaxID=2599291 RepID=UPI001E4DEE9D|nr:acyl-CoA dehydrogenase family protein [Chachezhania sediminis]
MSTRKLPSPMMSGRTIYQPEHEQFRDTCRKFFTAEILPNIAQWEKDEIVPRSFWRKAGEMGLLCVTVPEEYGGPGADYLYASIVDEELGYTGQASVTLQVQSDIIAPYILALGTEEQKQAWLPKMVTGEVIGGLCLTEPGTGSDVRNVRTRAVRDGDEYVINGSKTFITNGQNGDLFVVACQTGTGDRKGISLILVEAIRDGFRRGRNLEKLGMKASDTSELFFEDVRVPVTNLLGVENGGLAQVMKELPKERLAIATIAMANAQKAFDITLDYVREREAFGKKIFEFQNTQFKLAEIRSQLAMGWAYLDQCIARFMKDELTGEEAAIAKYSTTEMQCRIIDDCLQMHGGWGYMWEMPISRMYADARVRRIGGGSSEIMKLVIGRAL